MANVSEWFEEEPKEKPKKKKGNRFGVWKKCSCGKMVKVNSECPACTELKMPDGYPEGGE